MIKLSTTTTKITHVYPYWPHEQSDYSTTGIEWLINLLKWNCIYIENHLIFSRSKSIVLSTRIFIVLNKYLSISPENRKCPTNLSTILNFNVNTQNIFEMKTKSTCKLNAYMHFMRALMLIKHLPITNSFWTVFLLHTISINNRRTKIISCALWKTKKFMLIFLAELLFQNLLPSM